MINFLMQLNELIQKSVAKVLNNLTSVNFLTIMNASKLETSAWSIMWPEAIKDW